MFENAAKETNGEREGVFHFQGFVNEVDYWVDTEGENAIWYKATVSKYYWFIGSIDNLGSNTASLYSSSYMLKKKCPNNEGYVWSWKFSDGTSWIATNDVYIKCSNEDDFCTFENPCGVDQGDCDTHDECENGLACGSNNCPESLGLNPDFDCCYGTYLGDEHFCATGTRCGENEGDCDENNECQDGLVCGVNNCPEYLGFNYEIDCCCIALPDNTPSCENWAIVGYCIGTYEEYMSENCKKSCKICGATKKKIFSNSISTSYNKWKENHMGPNSKFLKKPNETDKIQIEAATIISHAYRKRYYQTLGKENEDTYWDHHYYESFQNHRRMSGIKKISKITKTNLRKSSTNSKGATSKLKTSYLANSKFGLTVVLNPNEAEYGMALKNNFVGFKTLVHTPYDFAEVDAVGMAIDKNVQSYIGVRGYHTWITEAADQLNLYQKRCLSRNDDISKYQNYGIQLNLFKTYTRKNCILECYANVYQNTCGCLPYHYPDFHLVWNTSTTACNYDGLKCLSKVRGTTKCVNSITYRYL